jgi:hypothetical protein
MAVCRNAAVTLVVYTEITLTEIPPRGPEAERTIALWGPLALEC